MMAYFLIKSGEDGTEIIQLEAEKLLKQITPDKYGNTEYGSELEFLDEIPKSDKGCWMGVSENAILIIKGEIIKPKKIQVVSKYEL